MSLELTRKIHRGKKCQPRETCIQAIRTAEWDLKNAKQEQVLQRKEDTVSSRDKDQEIEGP